MLPMEVKNGETWDKTGPKKRGLSERRNSNLFTEGQPLTPELIETFLKMMSKAGRTEGTQEAYRRCLNRLYEYLPEDKIIHKGTIEEWKQSLAGSGNFSGSSINLYCTAANMLLDWCGRADLWGITNVFEKKKNQPELTRKEFYRLLYAAKQAGNEQTYLIIKTFGLLGNTVSDLASLTAEAVQKGRVWFPHSGMTYIPSEFQGELKDYADRNEISCGPLFVSKSGMPLNRSNIFRYIRDLSTDAQVEEHKCTPRCLAGMCRRTKDNIRQSMELMEEELYERLLEEEAHAG